MKTNLLRTQGFNGTEKEWKLVKSSFIIPTPIWWYIFEYKLRVQLAGDTFIGSCSTVFICTSEMAVSHWTREHAGTCQYNQHSTLDSFHIGGKFWSNIIVNTPYLFNVNITFSCRNMSKLCLNELFSVAVNRRSAPRSHVTTARSSVLSSWTDEGKASGRRKNKITIIQSNAVCILCY
jgi:hypothetical protein